MSYTDLINLPKINGVTLVGDLKFKDLGLIPMSQDEINEIEFEIFGYVL